MLESAILEHLEVEVGVSLDILHIMCLIVRSPPCLWRTPAYGGLPLITGVRGVLPDYGGVSLIPPDYRGAPPP